MRYFAWIVAAGLIGLSAAYGLQTGGATLYRLADRLNEPLVYVAETYQAAATGLSSLLPSALRRLPVEVPEPPASGRAVLVDLANMKLGLYQDGQLLSSLPVLSKGRPGTPWETPAGRYAIASKKEKHFSSIGQVWMPYSMQFFGNFFIHGWPFDPSGEPVPPGYSGGCIRLADDAAEQVYRFVEVGTPVLIFGVEPVVDAEAKHYFLKREVASVPGVSARAYLVADLDSGEVLFEKNINEALPIASISKLMTALVSLDAINQYQTVTISNRAVATEGTSGNLKAGETLVSGNLLYPLLLESSNDAAEALAEHYGRDRFISLMNARSRAIGLEQTAFADPSGLSAGNVSTASDLYLLARHLYHAKPYIFELSAKLGHTTVNHGWVNDNDLLGSAYFLGGKNGYTDEARQTLLSLWSLPFSATENRRLAVIALGSQNRKQDAERLLAFVRETVVFRSSLAAAGAASGNFLAVAGATAQASVAPRRAATTTLAFVGDIMIDRGVDQSVSANASGRFSWLFDEIGPLATADILFGNLEGPVSDQGKNVGSQYSFRMDPEVIKALAAAGFDAVSVANNHAGDWSLAAFADTLKRLAGAKILAVGGGENRAAATMVKVIERDGLRYGFLGATDVGPNWLTAKAKQAGIVVASDPAWPTLIKEAAASVDFLIVSYHFGDEYQTTPNARQRQLAELAIDQGADLVIGHHPHVVQPVERYGEGLIAYSLGNFIFDQYFSEATMTGAALLVEVVDGQVAAFRTLPVAISKIFQPLVSEPS